LRSGEEFAGQLLWWKGDTLLFSTKDTTLRFHKSLVSSIDFTRKRSGDWWTSKQDINDPLLIRMLNKKEKSWYKEGGYITLLRNREFYLRADGHFEKLFRVINKVLQERGKSVANQRFYYHSYTEKAKLLFARGITYDGNTVSIRENAIEDAPFYRSFLAYNNLRQKKFAIPESRIGSILDYSYQISGKEKPEKPFYASINFAGWEPTETDSVVVNIPATHKIKYESNSLLKPIIIKKKDRIKYIWTLRSIEGKKHENLAPPFKDIFPRLTFASSMSWKYVDSLFSSSLYDSLVYPTELLSRLSKIHSLKPQERIDSLYELTCREIRYAAVPINATIPVARSIKTIYKLKYANSLDKTYFLYALLKKTGIESKIILTTEKTSGSLVRNVPSPTQFSYAILLVSNDSDTLFLDPRNDNYSQGYLNYQVQGEPGLVLGSDGKFVNIPLLENEKQSIQMLVKIEEDGSCDIKQKEYLYGGYGVEVRHLKEMKEEEVRKVIEKRVASIYPGAKLLDYYISPLSNLKQKVTMDIHYKINGFATVAGNYLLVSLPGINYSAASVGAIERDLPLFFYTFDEINHKIQFVFPKSFAVYHTGKNRNYSKGFLTFTSTFTVKDNQITYTDKYKRNSTLIEPANYENYKTCWQLMGELKEDLIVLKRK